MVYLQRSSPQVPFAILCFLLIASPLRAQQPGQTASPDDFATDFLKAFSSTDVDRILTFFTDDAYYEDVPSVENGWDVPLRGHEMIRESLVDTFQALPDLAFELVSASSAGNRMVIEWIMTGTHEGDFPGLPATGRTISIRGVSLIELEGGKIAWDRDYYDVYLLLTQLGVVPPMAQGGD